MLSNILSDDLPLVSVLIISHNQKDFIADTLASAYNQDYPKLEIVISDDASSDGTTEIIEEFSKTHPDLKKILNKTHLGITGNCNACLKHCTGKYITILGGDDLFLPGKISAQVKWMEMDRKRVICGHDCEIFDNISGKAITIDIPYRRSGYGVTAWIEDGMIISATSLMVRSTAIPVFGFDENVKIVSDWKFCIDILLGGGECGYIPGIYSKYRRHSTSITQKSAKYMSDTYKQSYLDQFYTLSYIEALYPEYSRSCKIRRNKLHLVRITDSYKSRDFKLFNAFIACFTVTIFSSISMRSLSRIFKNALKIK